MSTSVETSESISSLLIDFSFNLFSNHVLVNFFIQIVQETSSNFIDIIDFVNSLSNFNRSDIIDLTSWIWIECTSVQ